MPIQINTVTRPIMKLKTRLDRIVTVTLREEFGFGNSQFRILLALDIRPDISQKNIADFWDVTEASVSRQIKILEKKRLIKKGTNNMQLTPAGRKTLAKARETMDGVFEEIFKDVSDADRAHMTKLTEALIKNVTAYQDSHNQNF